MADRTGAATKSGSYQPVAVAVDVADTAEDLELQHHKEISSDSKKARFADDRSNTYNDDDNDDDVHADETQGFLAAGNSTRTYPGTATPSTHTHAPGYVPASASGSADAPKWLSRKLARIVVASIMTCLAVCVGFKLVTDNTGLVLSLAHPKAGPDGSSGSGSGSSSCGSRDNSRGAGDGCTCATTTATVPPHFQTSPELWPGPTATGQPAFMAQTVTINPSATYVANQPLQTNIAVDGELGHDPNIFRQMGYLSPYNPSPGFGVQEYALPPGAVIAQLQMLSRHGSRYPTVGTNVKTLGDKLAKIKGKFKASGALAFLEHWEYKMGYEILVPKGRQELFDSGVLHAYMYADLYNPHSKIIVRTTTQDRMLKSAENFLAGFFGLEWTNNATIEVIIERAGANNSLAGYLNCPNALKDTAGSTASAIWVQNYLRNATARFQSMIEGIEWTIEDTYAAQNLCPYETAAFGFSRFCSLFTYEEWVGFGYSIDLGFAGNSGFQSSTGRAVGIGYQQEVIARLRNHTLGYSGSQINVTLDSSTDTFPLNQSLYLDFSHDTNIVSILTAFGFKQFSQLLKPTEYPGPHNFTVAHVVPFGARLDIEIIDAPKPVAADRSGYDETGKATKYIHFVLNQRTLPLGASFPECDASRVDGWCELDTFLRVQEDMPARAKYDEACHGPFTPQPYGLINDGAPM